MAFDYAALRDETAEPLIREFGKPGTLWIPGVPTGPGYNPQPDDPQSQPVTVVQTEFKKEDNRGTVVQETDVMFLVSTEGVTADPKMADRLQVGSITFEVVRIDPLAPGPETMLWKLHARK
jgi:hypothetical protein